MNGAKEFVLVCVVFLVISCLTSAHPDKGDREHKLTEVYEQLPPKAELPSAVSVDGSPEQSQSRMSRSVKYTPYLDKFIEKVNQKAIRSPSLRLRFGRRSDPDFPPNFDLLNEELQQQQQEPNNQQQQMLSSMAFPYTGGYSDEVQKRYLGYTRQQRKPTRLRWGRSAPGEFSSAREQVMDAMAALARDQRSKVSRLRWGRSGPATYAGEWKDLSDNELVTLAIQYLINKQHLQDRLMESESAQQPQATEDEDSNAKN